MAAQLTVARIFMLALGWTLTMSPATSAMRHVSQCRLCHTCHLGDVPPDGSTPEPLDAGGAAAGAATTSTAVAAAAAAGTAAGSSTVHTVRGRRTLLKAKKRSYAYNPELDPTVPLQFKPSSYRPQPSAEMASLPECQECYGCTHNLTLISDSTVFLNVTYTSEMGATSSWIFRTNTNRTASGNAVVKVYCLPVPKRVGGSIPTCNPLRISEIMRQLMAIDKLSVECGFTDLIPRMWLGKVVGVVPGNGYPINWWGLWMDYVEGISMENFLYRGLPRRQSQDVIADMLNNRLNKTRVVRGAIFDLLTSQCDRHAQNLFIKEDGNLQLIDNESCLQHMWKNCGFDSVLVPTTQKQEIVRLANHYVLKLPTVTGGNASPRPFADPQLLLDYRCYLPQGREALGTDYPPQIQKCLRDIAAMTPKEVAKHYGFPEVRVANNLHTRATDMITHGYEWAAKYGHPQNARPKRYRLQPKCCSLRVNRSQFDCGHEWHPSFDLPYGNSITGHEWDKDRPDPGVYLGGTFPEDGEVDFGANATRAYGDISAGTSTTGATSTAAAGGTRVRRRRLWSSWLGIRGA